MHGSVSKVGKAVDRSFVCDFSSVVTEGAFEGEEQVSQLNNTICEHFLRQGMLDIAETLITESTLNIDGMYRVPHLTKTGYPN